VTIWDLRCRIYRLEADAEALKRDPVANREALTALHNEIQQCRRQLGHQRGFIYPVALELCFYERRVRVIADSPDEAVRIEHAWLVSHPGGGASRQRAEYSAWAAPLIQQLQQRRAS
jgi:hypothetical protein